MGTVFRIAGSVHDITGYDALDRLTSVACSASPMTDGDFFDYGCTNGNCVPSSRIAGIGCVS